MVAFHQSKAVKVTVHSSKSLATRNPDGVPLSWVVFGFHKNKCATRKIKDINPIWNETATFTLADPESVLKLTVKDDQDILGEIRIAVSEMPSPGEHDLKWRELLPAKHNTTPSGQLYLGCWVSEYREHTMDGMLKVPGQNTQLRPSSPNPIRYINQQLQKLSPRTSRRKAFLCEEPEVKEIVRDDSHLDKVSTKEVPNVTIVLNGDTRLLSASRDAVNNEKDELIEALVNGMLPVPRQNTHLRPSSPNPIRYINKQLQKLSPRPCRRKEFICEEPELKDVVRDDTHLDKVSTKEVPNVTIVLNDDTCLLSASREAVNNEKDELIEELVVELEGLKSENRNIREYIDQLLAQVIEKYPGALELH